MELNPTSLKRLILNNNSASLTCHRGCFQCMKNRRGVNFKILRVYFHQRSFVHQNGKGQERNYKED